jgi:hypothetical protein
MSVKFNFKQWRLKWVLHSCLEMTNLNPFVDNSMYRLWTYSLSVVLSMPYSKINGDVTWFSATWTNRRGQTKWNTAVLLCSQPEPRSQFSSLVVLFTPGLYTARIEHAQVFVFLSPIIFDVPVAKYNFLLSQQSINYMPHNPLRKNVFRYIMDKTSPQSFLVSTDSEENHKGESVCTLVSWCGTQNIC